MLVFEFIESHVLVSPNMSNELTIEMIEIPGGEFYMGSAHRPVYLKSYKIAKYSVTNAQFKTFRDSLSSWQRSTIAIPKTWEGERIPAGKEHHPVVLVNWYEANSFAQWLNLRLPTEVEWEKAARGGIFLDGDEYQQNKNPNPQRVYPWGNEFSSAKCNTLESGRKEVVAVEEFREGQSPYGVMQLSGNVWEWCSTLFETESDDLSTYGARVLRGGAWDVDASKATCSYRYRHNMEYRLASVGFRCAQDVY